MSDIHPKKLVILYILDDCCGIQCEYMNPEGEIETGALKHGDYFFNHREVYQYLSPLYKAKIVSKDELNWDDYIKGKQNVSKTT